MIAHLDAIARGQPHRIGAGELESKLLEIAEALRDENLPIDVLGMAEPTEQEVSESDRLFVAQLRLVAMSSERLRKCIYDHNCAFAQRSRWQRDRLVDVGEIGRLRSLNQRLRVAEAERSAGLDRRRERWRAGVRRRSTRPAWPAVRHRALIPRRA